MILKTGSLWSSKADLILVTGNATVRKDGCVVMGRGAALQAKHRFPGCDQLLGEQIARRKQYGVVICEGFREPELGLFQVKLHFRDEANIELIRNSVEDLISNRWVLSVDCPELPRDRLGFASEVASRAAISSTTG